MLMLLQSSVWSSQVE